jgi:cell division transport system ATP-binding protein
MLHAMIECQHLSKHYPNKVTLFDKLDFSLAAKELVFITGASGVGKSTFLNLIALLDTPTQGNILVNGRSLKQLKVRERAQYRSQLGLLPQTPKLLMNQTVYENVALPLVIRGGSGAAITKRVHAALDCVNLLTKVKQKSGDLSGGEQQRVGLARAIVHKPMLLLADEPTGNLDPQLSWEVMKLFVQLNEAGMSVLVATHDLALIAGTRQRIVTLKKGQLC